MKTYRKTILDALKANGFTSRQADVALDTVLHGITATLKDGGTVLLKNFGTFRVTARAARKFSNPNKPGEALTSPAYKSVHFRPSKFLKAALKNG